MDLNKYKEKYDLDTYNQKCYRPTDLEQTILNCISYNLSSVFKVSRVAFVVRNVIEARKNGV